MFIHILRTGSRFDYVKDFMLDGLIDTKQIVRFQRSSGWVTVGTDLIRGVGMACGYNGTDRRGAHG